MGGAFPADYKFNGLRAAYLIGMCVPPVMTANIAYEINRQMFER